MRQVHELPEIDFTAADYCAAPLPTLAGYAERFKLGRSQRGIEIFDYDLCRDTILNRRFGTGHPRLMELLGLPEGPALAYKRQSISFHNRGETRRKLRVPLTSLMGPQGSERFRTDIRHVVATTFDELPKDSPVDLIAALCDRIPSRVYCYWVGAPVEDADFVSRTSHIVQQVHTRNPETTGEVIRGFEDLLDYVEQRVAEARAAPANTLLHDLIRATDDGHLSEQELRNWVVKLAEANTDNSSHQIGIAVIELARRPDVWAELGRDPSLVPQALREVMRYHPRSLSTSREVLEDLEMDGVFIPMGAAIFPNIGAAHWNPNYFPEPDQFDIHRPDRPAHLNFGGGIFSCIGRFAVTIEIEEVIAYMVTHFPDLRITASAFSHSPMFTSVSELEAVLNG
ncbi:cytochrome P450 [Puniceibacterium sp. IMCC21224]|uniref:cytochrome P450 n=1 Tax=Puniceibacterium sp. IMCC21224 TaxID=1618204 RepID=UPI00065D5667|nr:cytochrome P450 [Puniceibacterium sp. IMCC21224]KMK66836.1 cytochrome P450 [Puniceibacterium sp. IMCC21224]